MKLKLDETTHEVHHSFDVDDVERTIDKAVTGVCVVIGVYMAGDVLRSLLKAE